METPILVAYQGYIKLLFMSTHKPINGRTIRQAMTRSIGIPFVSEFSWMHQAGTRYHSCKRLR